MTAATIRRHMLSTVVVFRRIGTDAYNKATYDDGTTYLARVQQDNTLTRDSDGREVVSGTQVYLPIQEIPPTVDDRLQITPGENEQIINVAVKRGPTRRLDHIQIMLK